MLAVRKTILPTEQLGPVPSHCVPMQTIVHVTSDDVHPIVIWSFSRFNKTYLDLEKSGQPIAEIRTFVHYIMRDRYTVVFFVHVNVHRLVHVLLRPILMYSCTYNSN